MAIRVFWICVTVLFLLDRGTDGKSLEKDTGGHVLVACDNLKLMKQLTQNDIPYRCTEGTKIKLFTMLDDDPTLASDLLTPETESRDLDDEEYEISEDRAATPPSTNTKCKDGKVFNYSLGICIPSKNPTRSKPKKTSTKTRIGATESDDTKDEDTKTDLTKCPEGFFFQTEVGVCKQIQNSRRKRSVSNELEQRAIGGSYFQLNIPFFDNLKCKLGHHYMSELGICVPLGVHQAQPLQTFPISIDFGDKHGCPPGTIYSSEIDICLPHASPVKTSHPEIVFYNKDDPNAAALQQDYKVIKHKCRPGLTYVSELGLCATFEKPSEEHVEHLIKKAEIHQKEMIAQILATTPDPFALKLLPLTRDQVGFRKCDENTVYVSELDICMPYLSP